MKTLEKTEHIAEMTVDGKKNLRLNFHCKKC